VESPAIHDGVAFLLSRIPHRLHVVLARAAIRRCRRRGFGRAISSPSCGPPICVSHPLNRRGSSSGCGSSISHRRQSQPWRPRPRVGRWACNGPRCLCVRDRIPTPCWALIETHRYLLDCLTEEVLERQPDRIRALLLYSSILERITGPLVQRSHGEGRRAGRARATGTRQPVRRAP
jgi:LuxR family maltose regulon positive regulatory protein